MTPDEPDQRLADLLATLDADLAGGRLAESAPDPDLPPDQLRVYRLAREGLLRLEKAWPRGGKEDTPTFDMLAGVGRFGKYLLSRELGRGGEGVVFLATDTHSGRQVALKLPRLEALLGGDVRDRFMRESAALIGLEHPGLVPVLEAGEVGGVCYLASAYAGDVSLADWLEGRADPVPVRTAAAVVAAVARAVEYLHEHHTLHRDVKPSNVLLESPGPSAATDLDLAVSGVPRLTDFGLAKRFDPTDTVGSTTTGSTTDGVTGGPVGTVEYMAPEQADGRAELVARPTDVYALGVVLFELLAGHPPFRGRNRFDTIRKVLTEPAPSLCRIRREVPADLEAVCRKCLEKDPRRRYATAAQVSDDLGRYLAGLPTLARPTPWWAHAGRWLRRRPAWAVLLLTAVLALPLVAVAGVWYQRGVEAAHAEELRDALFASDERNVPTAVHRLRGYLPHVEGDLRRVVADADRSAGERLRAAVVLAPADRGAADYLGERVWDAAPVQLGWACDALDGRAGERVAKWEAEVRSAGSAPDRRLRAACALARLAPQSPALAEHATEVADLLLAERVETVLQWAAFLRPHARRFLPRLAAVYADPTRTPSARATAAAVLAEFAADDVPALVGWLEQADDPAFLSFMAKLRANAGAPDGLRKAVAALDTAGGTADDLAHRRANLLIALMLLNDTAAARDGLRAGEPRLRFRLIHQMAGRQVGLGRVAELLASAADDDTRYAVLLALGEYDPRQVPADVRKRVADLYRDTKTAGVHSAAEWLLGVRWQSPPPPAKGSAEDAADCKRGWFVTPEGHTLAVLPANGANRLAVGTREVTVGQFRRFTAEMAANGDVTAKHYEQKRFVSPTADHGGPMADVSYVDAVLYCNWLSEKEQLTPCYRVVRAAKLNEMSCTGPSGGSDRPGYRLPTEGEWQAACAGGAKTRRFFGDDARLLPEYAWYFDTAGGGTHPVGRLRPNPFGLFDVYGNVAEWCASGKYNPNNPVQAVRGGSWRESARDQTSASRPTQYELAYMNDTGFRIVRELPSAPTVLECGR